VTTDQIDSAGSLLQILYLKSSCLDVTAIGTIDHKSKEK